MYSRKHSGILKRILVPALALAMLCSVALSGCGKSSVALTNFLEGTTIDGVDVSGLTAEEAAETIRSAADAYRLNVTLDGVSFQLSAKQLDMTYNENTDFTEILTTQAEDSSQLTFTVEDLFTVADTDSIETAMVAAAADASGAGETASATQLTASAAETSSGSSDASAAETSSSATESTGNGQTILVADKTQAGIEYDATAQKFVGVDGEAGTTTDYTKAAEQVSAAAAMLQDEVSVQSEQVETSGEKAQGNSSVTKALETANKYLDIKLTYSFTPEGGETSYEEINGELIASWLYVEPDRLTVSIDTSALTAYVNEIANAHSTSGSATFTTTDGTAVAVDTPTAGKTVDSVALYNDLYECLTSFTSGERTAPYATTGSEEETIDTSGNWVEIDLTHQTVYCYNHNELVCTAPCVTGCVASGYGTPTGTYAIFSMDRDRYLSGPGYKTWVSYFMPFNGDIGMHDCSWRSDFGGTNYYYGGSHGCVNLPYWAAETIFNNCHVGTPVIVYGETYPPRSDAVWTGTTEYTKTVGDASFHLDLVNNSDAPNTYSSSDNSVATVDGSGNVTIVGPGTCRITVSTAETGSYNASSKDVTITVNPRTKADQYVSVAGETTLSIGGTTSLSVTSDTNNTPVFSGYDASVISVDGSGNVTALAAGTTTVTVTVPGNDNYLEGSSSIEIQVVKSDQSVSLTGLPSAMTVGGTALGAVSCETGFSVSSSDTSVATVTDNGDGTVTVTAVGEGYAEITVTAAGSDIYNEGSCTIPITVTA